MLSLLFACGSVGSAVSSAGVVAGMWCCWYAVGSVGGVFLLVICSWSLLAMCFLFAVCGVGHVFLVVLVVVAKLLAQP